MTEKKILTPEEHEMLHGSDRSAYQLAVYDRLWEVQDANAIIWLDQLEVGQRDVPPEGFKLSPEVYAEAQEHMAKELLEKQLAMAPMSDEETEEALKRIYNRSMKRPFAYGVGTTARDLREAIDAEGYTLVKKS